MCSFVNGSNIHSHLADKFPSIEEALEMAQLAKVVYHFKSQNETYCASFNELPYVYCEWYHHDTDLGTQVMLVSNSRKKYLAVVFAGTDDFRTSLLDADLLMKPFGDNDTVHLEDPMIKVHEGFDNAVFSHVLWDEISSKLEHLIRKYRRYRLWTTGHSLGAAAALFTATALAKQGHTVTSINFGCPQTGNEAWRDYFNATSPLKDRLGVWRVVQGWDLVPRLPEFFLHVGHTIQIWSENHHKYDKYSPSQIGAYYQHIVSCLRVSTRDKYAGVSDESNVCASFTIHSQGSPSLGYAGVPPGWSSKPYFWVPGALASHFMEKYVEHLQDLLHKKLWVSKFEVVEPQALDDDIWDNPPDDTYEMDYFQQFDGDEELQENL
jgi:hypothetical protein